MNMRMMAQPTDITAGPVTAEVPTEKVRGPLYFVVRRLCRSRPAQIGSVIVAIVAFIALYGWIAYHSAYNIQTRDVRLPPSAAHLFGTDDLGRDILVRVFYGAHLTLGCGILIVLLAAAIGIPLGLLSAYAGGRTDNYLMRAMDMILAFPSILLAMAIVAALGFNLLNIVLAIGIVYIPKFARVVRSSALIEKSLDYTSAARALGCGRTRIVLRHLLPNCLGPVIVLASLTLASAILEAAALSFLQLGAQPPMPEWGRMLNDGRQSFQTRPHIMIFPGLAIAISVLGINLLGDGLRDAIDVRQ
jgi:peptide/nickel transport system permease protein